MFSWGIERDRGMKWVKTFVLGKLTFGTATFSKRSLFWILPSFTLRILELLGTSTFNFLKIF